MISLTNSTKSCKRKSLKNDPKSEKQTVINGRGQIFLNDSSKPENLLIKIKSTKNLTPDATAAPAMPQY